MVPELMTLVQLSSSSRRKGYHYIALGPIRIKATGTSLAFWRKEYVLKEPFSINPSLLYPPVPQDWRLKSA